MRIPLLAVCVSALLCNSATLWAQPGPPPNGGPGRPDDGQRRGPPDGRRGAANVNGAQLLVERMLAFDTNEDLELSLGEVTDGRLHRLFRRADADEDGAVTKAELTAVGTAIAEEFPNAGMRGGPPGGGPGGPGGPGGFGGPPPGRGGPPGAPNRRSAEDPFSGRRSQQQ